MRKNKDWSINKLSYKTHPLYDLIHRATDNDLVAEDEELNNKICSEILKCQESSKFASKIIHKIINKSLIGHCHQSIWYCLLLLDYTVKNTDSKFCSTILTKEFLGDFVKIVDPKYLVPEFVQEKFLYIMKEWAHTLLDVNGYLNLARYYKSIENIPHGGPMNTAKVNKHTYQSDKCGIVITKPIPQTTSISPKDKIVNDIDVIETNLAIFSDTIRSVNPETVTNEELKFLEELFETGLKMQDRINELLPNIDWEDIINQLIQVNDKILSTSDKYKRIVKMKSQLTLSGYKRQSSKSPLEEIYDATNFVKDVPNNNLFEKNSSHSLPSYSEAVSSQDRKSTFNEELNLIDFDDNNSNESHKNKPLPPIPVTDNSNINRPVPGRTEQSGAIKQGLSSNDFDDFIDQIARRHKPNEPDEIYDKIGN